MSAPNLQASQRIAHNQCQVLLGLWAQVAPHLRTDRALPARIERLLRADRRFGSRDRRLYRELLYTAVRAFPWIEDQPEEIIASRLATLAVDTPATRTFRAVFASADATAGLNPDHLLPGWIEAECPSAADPALRAAWLDRAPLWIRLQTTDAESVAAEFTRLGWSWIPSPLKADAWKLDGDRDLTTTDAWAAGRVEVQDLGSQLLLPAARPAPGTRWLDACAGAGGKTLQLAQLLGSAGHVTAHDIRPAALDELVIRARRAGLDGRITVARTLAADARFDGVLVDAPCSGTGTWRRSPHLKWTTTPAQIADAARVQSELLARFARAVAPGGRLLYATCSLCRRENEDVVQAFLQKQPEFVAEPLAETFGWPLGTVGLTLTPGPNDNDGFFVAALRRVASG